MQIIAICPEHNIRATVEISYIPTHKLQSPGEYIKGIAEGCSLINKGLSCPNSNECPLYLAAPHETTSPYTIFDFCK